MIVKRDYTNFNPQAGNSITSSTHASHIEQKPKTLDCCAWIISNYFFVCKLCIALLVKLILQGCQIFISGCQNQIISGLSEKVGKNLIGFNNSKKNVSFSFYQNK